MLKNKTTHWLSIPLLSLLCSFACYSQDKSNAALFQYDGVLELRLSLSFKEIKKNTTDSTFLPGVLHYKQGDAWDSIKISVRSRGQFRKKNCFFTPLHVKIKKEDALGSLFEGNKSLKLVLPCETSKDNNKLLLKEYICYKLYDQISPYTFNTRLLEIDLMETSGGGRPKDFKVLGFFIEDDELVAKRHHAEVVENINLHPLGLKDTFAIQHDLFQYMISNTDWSTTFLHNAKLMKIEPNTFIPLAYDFDMSGFVDAPYAIVDATLNAGSVTDRVYRGFCRKNDNVVQYVRRQYVSLEPRIKSTIDSYSSHFDPKEINSINRFMDDFFDTMKSDTKFQNYIIEKCRPK